MIVTSLGRYGSVTTYLKSVYLPECRVNVFTNYRNVILAPGFICGF